MYEMVTGRRAFKGDSNISTLAAVLHDEPEAVSRIVRGISSELGRIIEKTLKKDRGLRYQSASDLLTDLRRLQRDHESGRMASQPIELRAKMWRIALLAAVLAIALGALLVLLSAGGLRDRLRPRGTPPTGQIRLVVLPFDNLSGDPEQEYFSDGITEEMTAQLARLQPERLAVIGRSSAMTYKGGKKTIDQIGKELSVQYVLTGSVRRQGRRVRVTALLIKVSDQTHVWAEDFDRDLNDVLSVQTELAQEVSRQIRVTVPPEERSRETRARPVSPAAHEALLKGRFHLEKLTKEGGDKAGELFRQAIGIDPNYAPAYAALALHYTQLVHADLLPPREAFPQAKSCAEKALEIDPTLAEGWFASAQVRFLYEWDWSGAEKDLERGLELSPNDVFGHQTYANILSATGRPQEAIRQAKLARDIDPASLAANYFCGQHYFYARQYDQCMKLERQTLELDPRQPQGHLILGLALAEIGDLTPAVAEIQASHSYSHFDVYRGFLGYVYGLAGDTERARKELVDYRRRSSSGYTSAWLIAVIYAGLGEKEEALASLEKAYKDRDHNMALIKCWPMFDRLHSDPRFQSLLRRMNLPQ
jgi:TolB-like protein/Tfp pilus assembly protein PilF